MARIPRHPQQVFRAVTVGALAVASLLAGQASASAAPIILTFTNYAQQCQVFSTTALFGNACERYIFDNGMVAIGSHGGIYQGGTIVNADGQHLIQVESSEPFDLIGLTGRFGFPFGSSAYVVTSSAGGSFVLQPPPDPVLGVGCGVGAFSTDFAGPEWQDLLWFRIVQATPGDCGLSSLTISEIEIVPEPSLTTLALVGLAGLAASRRRRVRRPQV